MKKLAKVNKHGQPFLANIIVGILSIYFTVFAPDAWVDEKKSKVGYEIPFTD